MHAHALAALILVAPLAAQTLVVQPTKAEKTTESRTVKLASGASLKVQNTNGSIRVEAWDKEEVEFTGEFKPSSKDEQVKVVLDASAGKLEIRGEYPKHSGWGSYRGPECQMTLKVPRKVLPTLESVNGNITLCGTFGAAVLETTNGTIKAKDLAEALEARTTNGNIGLEKVQGPLALKTVNGSIKGTGLDGSGKGIQAKTVNGAIHFQIAGLKGHLKASTVNGDIAFNAKGKSVDQVEIKKHRVTATFPGSDQAITLGTVNGSITLE
jgi:DUF4097 and DUF4098 domain-containing protein YvlB